MNEYEPVDISNVCNSQLDVLKSETDPVPGLQSLRGLPFLIGNPVVDSDSKRLIVLNGQDSPVRIKVNRPAINIVFAHTQLETNVVQDGRWGSQVADYVFHIDGEEDIIVPVRERFEIGVVPGEGTIPGGITPQFSSVTDMYPEMMPRYEGEFGRAGWRLMESRGAGTRWYYLWCWKNPVPSKVVEYIDIIPKGPRFAVSGLTLGHVKEHPFAREGRVPAIITLKNETPSSSYKDIRVDVDRGISSYTQSLPDQPLSEFLESPYKGWGQVANSSSNPSYVNLSAIPSATLTVFQGDNEIGDVKWGDLQSSGCIETENLKIELFEKGRNWVKVRVIDDSDGLPVPCRIHFRSIHGIPYQPYGHHNHINSELDTFNYDVGGDVRLGGQTYAYIDGYCEGWLPLGEVVVDIARGIEYEPVRQIIEIKPGQNELELRINRWINMKDKGWYSGDAHVHFLSAQGALTEAKAEDVNVVNVLQCQWGSLFTGTEEFTGLPHMAGDTDYVAYVGQENRQNLMGHLILMGLKRHIMPWCTDGPGEAEIGGSMESTLSEWADKCHEQGGTVAAAHFWGLNREAASLVATGRLDAIELKGHQNKFPHDEYYRVLNSGYRIPIIGGTDKMSSEVALGFWRTYVRMGKHDEFTYESWCKNMKLGRTFMTSGPIIDFSVEGQQIGETISLDKSGYVEVEVSAESVLPIHRLDIIVNGNVVATTQSVEGKRNLEIKEQVKIDSHSWIAVRCGSPDYFGDPDYDEMKRGIYAHTSPVYVEVGGDWYMFDRNTLEHMLTVVNGDIEYIESTSSQYSNGNVTHHHGEDDHLDWLKRPFLEARELLVNRLTTGK